jgi:glucokinase
MSYPIVGVDIGGTKIAAGLVDSSGNITCQKRVPMPTGDGTAALGAVKSAIDSVCDDLGADARPAVSAIGVCAPGPLDPNTGIILNPPNLPAWRNFPLAAEIAKSYSVPVRLDNDGNAAALAEAIWGAGRGYRNIFYATIGTGIGTGIIFDRHIYHGRTGAAAEGGHMTIDYRGPLCACGKLGCIETLASGTAIARRASEAIAAGRSSSITKQDIDKPITAESVGRAYMKNDPLAKEILQETAMFVSVWLGNIIDLLEPDAIVIGGGAAPLLEPFFEDIRVQIPAWSVNPRSREIPLLRAHYGPDAGIAGAAALCLQNPSYDSLNCTGPAA